VTYSIVARDPATGDLGVAVQSKFLAVGAVVPWARAGVGAVATQSFANVAYGPDGLAQLSQGSLAQDTVDALVGPDEHRATRQVGLVDAHGGSATYTGADCLAWAGGRTGDGWAAQGNILAGPSVVDALVDTLLAGARPFPELLVACLAAADEQGGDRRGRESAALLIVREGGGYGGANDRWIDLRVDQHDDPIGELARVLGHVRLYFDRPDPADLLPVDDALAADLRRGLETVGAQPGGRFESIFTTMSGKPADDVPRPCTGSPRPIPSNWDETWQAALERWMDVENLEERTAAPGWIDPRVLSILRARAG
jgi:uncharacterized Ntn-hydrolase superfamily protein